jgi:hypothetical protein
MLSIISVVFVRAVSAFIFGYNSFETMNMMSFRFLHSIEMLAESPKMNLLISK